MELKPAGKNFKALCPFHKEKTPSFMVSPEYQSWHCFGACNEGGDVIKFLMKYENLEFYDALRILAEKTGVEIPRGGARDFNINNNLYSLLEAAKEFFRLQLSKSDSAKKYLSQRGLKTETVNEFGLGLAPDESDALTRYLLKTGFNIADVERAGMTLKTERGTYWDRFRSRLMFPIFNHIGKVAGFSGRILPGADDSKVGKYINTPETPIYQKSKILYGLHKTKNDIREAKQAVLVEGQMDFLMVWQAGVKNIAAISGTALTDEHLKILRRLADELILSFDADEAGQAAAEKGIDAAHAFDFGVKLLVMGGDDLPAGQAGLPVGIQGRFKDPAEVAEKNPNLMRTLIEKAKPVMDYYFQKYLGNKLTDLKTKKQNIRAILSKMKSLASAVERDHWLKELAILANLDEKILLEELDMLKENRINPVSSGTVSADNPADSPAESDLSRRDLISQRLIGIGLNLAGQDKGKLKSLLEENLIYLPLYYRDIYKGNIEGDLEKIVSLISLRFSFENEESDASKTEKEFLNLLRELKIEYLKEKRQEISQLIKKLENSGEEKALSEALKEFDNISREMHSLRV